MTTGTTAYAMAERHYEANKYKRGRNVGSAPIDKRSKTTFRLIKHTDAHTYAVHLYNTDIVTFHEDGTITLDCDGWGDRTVTHTYMNAALRKFVVWGIGIGKRKIFNHSQEFYHCQDRSMVRYYDGMQIDQQGNVVTPLIPFKRKQADKAKIAEFRQDVEESGFKAVFKVLHYASEHDGKFIRPGFPAREIVTQNSKAEYWAALIKYHKFDTVYTVAGYRVTARTPAETWTRIMREATQRMTEVVDTNVYSVPA